jgi:hypothetical protein
LLSGILFITQIFPIYALFDYWTERKRGRKGEHIHLGQLRLYLQRQPEKREEEKEKKRKRKEDGDDPDFGIFDFRNVCE